MGAGWGTTISKYPEKEVEPARRPLRKPALLHKARGNAICTWVLRLLSHWSLSSTSQRKARIGFLPPLRAINTTPFVHLFPFPRQPGLGRCCRSAPAVSACPPSTRTRVGGARWPPETEPHSRTRPGSGGGAESCRGGVDGKEAHRGRRGAVPSNPLHQLGPSTCSVSSRDSLRGYWVAGAAEQIFCRPRRALGAGPRDSPQEGWGADACLVGQKDTYRRAPLC